MSPEFQGAFVAKSQPEPKCLLVHWNSWNNLQWNMNESMIFTYIFWKYHPWNRRLFCSGLHVQRTYPIVTLGIGLSLKCDCFILCYYTFYLSYEYLMHSWHFILACVWNANVLYKLLPLYNFTWNCSIPFYYETIGALMTPYGVRHFIVRIISAGQYISCTCDIVYLSVFEIQLFLSFYYRFSYIFLNSLWLTDAVWPQTSVSTLV